MADNWVVVQVGPVLQVPRQARFRNKQGWWYVYRRSRFADGVDERYAEPWGATKYPDRNEAEYMMHLEAEDKRMPWRVVRFPVTISYFASREEAERLKPFASDSVVRAKWGEGNEDDTRG